MLQMTTNYIWLTKYQDSNKKHWLPIQKCVVFKIVTLVYRSLFSHAPGYLADDCQLITDAHARLLHSCKTTAFRRHDDAECPPYIQLLRGQDLCSCCCHKSWNSLPSDLRRADLSYSRFRRSLKTFSFGQPNHGTTLLTAPCSNILTYLLTDSKSTRKICKCKCSVKKLS